MLVEEPFTGRAFYVSNTVTKIEMDWLHEIWLRFNLSRSGLGAGDAA